MKERLETVILYEAMRRFPWAWPPESDKEDARRAKAGKEPRDWEPTRQQAIKQVRASLDRTYG